VERVGITGVTMDDLARAKAQGLVMKLLCVAERASEHNASNIAHRGASDGGSPAGERNASSIAHRGAGDGGSPAGERYRLSVKPTALPPTHPMARLSAGQMGVTYRTDVNGDITAVIEEGNPMPTAAAVVRDLINLYWQA
jgi:homoserine dehydrogenase